MLQALAQRVRDMRTIKQLCQHAERHANAEGQQRPGAGRAGGREGLSSCP